MSIINPTSSILSSLQQLSRFRPRPKASSSLSFSNVMSGVGNVLSGGASTVLGDNANQLQDLIQVQMEAQAQMQTVSMESNIEKSKHETHMTAIRNIRTN